MKKMIFFILVFIVFLTSQMLSSSLPYCPPENGPITIIHPNVENCATFYICDWGFAFLDYCSSGLYYCSELGYCSYPDDYQCSYSDCKMSGGFPGFDRCGINEGFCYTPFMHHVGNGKFEQRCEWTGHPNDICLR